MLFHEDVGVELGDPLLALDGPLEMAQRGVEAGLDLGPEELRELLGEIGWRFIAQLPREPGLDELVVERIQLAGMVGVAELADQVGGPNQGRLGGGRGVVLGQGIGKRVSSIAPAIRSGSSGGRLRQRWRTKILPRSIW